jgi:purine-nucleoside phosphorylase
MQMKKDVHLTGRDLLGMVQVRPGDFGKVAIIPGTAERRDAILEYLEKPVKSFSFFEYTMFTGFYEGVKVAVGNGGRFSPDSAIIAEILCAGQVEYIIRAGSCGALDEKIAVGDIVLATGVVRGDGVTPYYVDKDFKTVADPTLTGIVEKTAAAAGVAVKKGLMWTTDALLRETRPIVEGVRKEGAVAVDMVSSALMTIAQLNKVKAASISAVSDNLITGELGFMNPAYYEAEMKVVTICLEAVKALAQQK